MADNIKIIGNIVNTQQISRYDSDDVNLLAPQNLSEYFGQQNDYIEYFVYDAGSNLLNFNYSYKDFKLPSNSYIDPISGSLPIIEIDPIKDLQNLGYSSGEFKVQYNLFNNKLSNPNAELFLKEISADRTELRVGSTILTNEQIENGAAALINEYTGSAYFVDYLLNFGNNNQVVAVNVALNKVDSGYEILFKLYQPLPDNIQEKATLWVVKEKTNPYVFDINLDKLILPTPGPQLRGPNFGIDIPNQNNVATSYQTYDSLVDSIQSISTKSYQQLLSLITSQSIDINVDYTDFNNFVFFSSIEKRVKNFYDKVKSIEDYNTQITVYTPQTGSNPTLINEINTAKSSIETTISQFDGYEYYLYFESSSYAWPKTNSSLPYILASTASVDAWYSALTSSAELYDNDNQNNLAYTIPSFIKDDGNNDSYITFINMVGHYFDNIWIYLQSITDINVANNNLEQGVSKDLVYFVLESLGTKLYNQYGDSDNVDFLVGNSGSANFDNNFTITGSYLNTIPRKDLLAESYKRIYHNLPLLLKTKGTSYGLQTLVSTFGITGSTLQVKEYGGDVKSGLLDEYNNEKVRIVSNTIYSGSVLSPFISLQEVPTSSNEFRTNDLHYVDVSFSPQEKIDTFISASIVTANPTWSIDDYIGDPRFQYSSSYLTLEQERNTYLSPLSASVVPFTGSQGNGLIGATDYNSFIRLIQFFDNSLFKMIQDYVPVRANLSTGITISSPILERNKWSYSNPSNTSNIDVNKGVIETLNIDTEYTDIYEHLTGSKVAYYDGNLTGSYINVHNYFASGNFNPYLNLTSSLTAGGIYLFNHTDFNVTLNNVSKSRQSLNRQDIEYVYGTTNSILSRAELQDSYETLKTHQLSRYEGVKIYSAKYNDYTVGDLSFGKSAVIDRQSYKVGWVKNIPSQSLNFYDKTSINLKYLVDKNNNLTELSLANNNLCEVQNTFKSGDTVILSISDVQQPSNQTTLDGIKTIFKGGFSYDPILYREANETLKFTRSTYIDFVEKNIGVKAYCNDNYSYYALDGYKDNTIFNNQPTLIAQNQGGGHDGLYTYKVNGVDTAKAMSYLEYTSTTWPYSSVINNTGGGVRSNDKKFVYSFNLLNFNDTTNGYNNEPKESTYSKLNNSDRFYYIVPRSGTYKLNGLIPFSFRINDKGTKSGARGNGAVGFKVVGIVERSKDNGTTWSYIAKTTLKLINRKNNVAVNNNESYITADSDTDSDVAEGLVNCVLDSSYILDENDIIRFQFYILTVTNIFGVGDGTGISTEFDFKINGTLDSSPFTKAFFEIYDENTKITEYNYTRTYGQVPSLFTTFNLYDNAIIFSSDAQELFTPTYTFNPTLPASNYYTPVVDPFGIQKYDLIRIGSFTSPNASYYEVREVGTYNTQTYVLLDRAISDVDIPLFKNAQSFAILRPKPNETSVIINYKKQLGEVAQTILIPQDANDIKTDVGNIFKTINTSIL